MRGICTAAEVPELTRSLLYQRYRRNVGTGLKPSAATAWDHWCSMRSALGRSTSVGEDEFGPEATAEFVTYMVGTRGVAPKTASQYLSSIRPRLEFEARRRLGWRNDPQARMTASLVAANPGGQRSKLPITAPIVRRAVAQRSRWSSGARAAMAFGWSLCLRGSEYLDKRGVCKLRVRDITFDKVDGHEVVVARIRGKTDSHQGADRLAGAIDITTSNRPDVDPMDVVALLKAHWAERPGLRPSDPVFVHPSGSPVTARFMSAMVKDAVQEAGLDPRKYASHSLRIGCASALAEAGYSDSFIMDFGRWKSLAFKIYLRRSRSALAKVSGAIARTNVKPLRR